MQEAIKKLRVRKLLGTIISIATKMLKYGDVLVEWML